MKYPKKTWQLLGFTTIYSLALTIFPKVASANQPPSVQRSDDYQVAQMTDCREVDVNTRLNIRRQPDGQVIGTLEDEQTVNIIGEPENGWVQIDAPEDGYIAARYLTYCTGAVPPSQPVTQTTPTTSGSGQVSTVPGSNCRQVVSPNLSVRSEPNGEVIGTLDENQTVYIANEGYDGWVPIERPIDGYVNSASLGYCYQ
ncbi:SH3 domain-containing protein [Coleofasciculus sp.]|uniref:SH3 domain-containing protein n=1 Tax=Coleofasciculus sp. TaxID=3100458 RepID=UPI0039F9D6AD